MKISAKHQKKIEELLPKKDQQAFVNTAINNAIKAYESANAEVVEVFCDGGSRGNPGLAGGGYAIYRGGRLAEKGSEFFGKQTNNRAEYLSLRLALGEVQTHFPDLGVRCYMDSELVVKQMRGEYKVKSENVKALHKEVRRIADSFPSFVIAHIPRSQNKVADTLANEAMDSGVL